jgi:hypothetical protein
MDFLPDGTFYLEDPAALKIPETSEGSGATATLQGPGSGRRLPTLDTSSGFIDDGTLRVADPDALAVPDPNTWRTADPITPAKPISGSGSNWEWDWETGLVRETWMSTIQQDQHAWEKVGRSWDWLAGCCEECGSIAVASTPISDVEPSISALFNINNDSGGALPYDPSDPHNLIGFWFPSVLWTHDQLCEFLYNEWAKDYLQAIEIRETCILALSSISEADWTDLAVELLLAAIGSAALGYAVESLNNSGQAGSATREERANRRSREAGRRVGQLLRRLGEQAVARTAAAGGGSAAAGGGIGSALGSAARGFGLTFILFHSPLLTWDLFQDMKNSGKLAQYCYSQFPLPSRPANCHLPPKPAAAIHTCRITWKCGTRKRQGNKP